jgi:pimeloyl-ACP methyl ester carboxylesterase
MSNHTEFAQRAGARILFAHKDMDYYLSWVLGRAFCDGCDAAEVMAQARTITDGDAASWQAAWAPLAERAEQDAQHALETGDTTHARSRFLHACTYWRAPLFIMQHSDARFRPYVARMQACFAAAGALFDPPIMPFACAYGDKTLSGYRWHAHGHAPQAPALIVVGGVETWAEDGYFMVGHLPAAQGFVTFSVDLPGQGMTPDLGLHFRAQMDLPAHALVDAIVADPAVDPSRIALYGFSWGGHIVCKAAAADARVRALIANPAMPDVFRAALAQQRGIARSDPVSRTAFQQIVWRFGLSLVPTPRNIARRFAKFSDYLRHGKADVRAISCPTLLLAGASEPEITLRIARSTLAALPNPQSKLVIFTREQGGEAHCQVVTPALPTSTLLSWLADLN